MSFAIFVYKRKMLDISWKGQFLWTVMVNLGMTWRSAIYGPYLFSNKWTGKKSFLDHEKQLFSGATKRRIARSSSNKHPS